MDDFVTKPFRASESLRELATVFLDEYPKLLDAIATASSRGDASELRRADLPPIQIYRHLRNAVLSGWFF